MPSLEKFTGCITTSTNPPQQYNRDLMLFRPWNKKKTNLSQWLLEVTDHSDSKIFFVFLFSLPWNYLSTPIFRLLAQFTTVLHQPSRHTIIFSSSPFLSFSLSTGSTFDGSGEWGELIREELPERESGNLIFPLIAPLSLAPQPCETLLRRPNLERAYWKENREVEKKNDVDHKLWART